MFSGKKRLIICISIAALAIIAFILIPSFKNYLIDSLHWPLEFFSHISQEIQGITLYHQNLVQNQHLKKEIGSIRRRLHEAGELYLENIRLRKLLGFKKKSVYRMTAAAVIGYDPSNLSSIIIVDKGKRQGIREGMAVITNDGLVGRVVEVGGESAKVLLINDINSGVAVLVQRSREKGLVSGTLTRGLILHYLPYDADVKISDMVITSGLSGLYPKGILIGKVTEVQEEKSPGEISAVIEPSVNLIQLEEVLVVLAPSEIQKQKH